MVAKDGLPFRVFCTSEDMKNLLLRKVLKEKLSEFDLSLDKDIVGITTDGASVMKKVGRLIEPLLQLCYAHGVQLGITDVIYKKTVQSNPEEEFEDPELNTNRSAEEEEVLGDNPDNYDGNLKTLSEKLVSSMNNHISERRIKATAVLLYLKNPNIYQDDLEQWKEDLSLRAIAAQNYTSLQEDLEETLRASKTESPFKPVSTSLDRLESVIKKEMDLFECGGTKDGIPNISGSRGIDVSNPAGSRIYDLESGLHSLATRINSKPRYFVVCVQRYIHT
ncbi:hypothetical protein EVAR_18981_1 [Eumeta japonica]|uniref:Uncharacterized protein n=1 Tax=Eumeta variegata TaxID=151549 RepID=A0A4C1X025_EUMVA|nr:hypothetical protein EVAR_18981_1 [Eumeta japonica]